MQLWADMELDVPYYFLYYPELEVRSIGSHSLVDLLEHPKPSVAYSIKDEHYLDTLILDNLPNDLNSLKQTHPELFI